MSAFPSHPLRTVAIVRFLHTSDWHLGRSLHGEPLLDAQAAVLDHLVDVAAAEAVDAVVVAGDVYDRAIPPVEAVELLDDVLGRLASLGVPVVLIGGNHDSAVRLRFGQDLLAAAGVPVRTDPAGCGQPVLVTTAAGEQLAIYPLPYLEPSLTAGLLEADGPRHVAVLDAAMGRVRADLAGRGEVTSLVVAHAFVAGAAPCDSERDVAVGGTAAVPTSTFDGVDAVALGHLHGPQQPGPRLGYSGSPLAYSFSEADHTKSISLVEVTRGAVPTVERLPTPVPRRVARLRGTLDELLADPRLAEHETAWLEITLTDDERPHAPMDRLRQRFPGVLRLVLDVPAGPAAATYRVAVEGRSDLDVCTAFVDHVRGRAADDDEVALLDAALAAGHVEEVAPLRRVPAAEVLEADEVA